jgi:hypothetical protein
MKFKVKAPCVIRGGTRFSLSLIKLLITYQKKKKVKTPVKLFCDNQVSMHIVRNLVFHERMKHLKVSCHFAHDKLTNKEIVTPYVKTKYQLVDFFTKSLSPRRVAFMYSKLGSYDIYSLT